MNKKTSKNVIAIDKIILKQILTRLNAICRTLISIMNEIDCEELNPDYVSPRTERKTTLAEREDNARQVIYDTLRVRTTWCTAKTVIGSCPQKTKGVIPSTIRRVLNDLVSDYPDRVEKRKIKGVTQYKLTEHGRVCKDPVNFSKKNKNQMTLDLEEA